MHVKPLERQTSAGPTPGGADPGAPDLGDLGIDDFVRQHQAGLWRYLRYLGADAARAEELTQEVLVRGIRADLLVESHDVAMRWLRTTARNLWVDDRRRAQRRGRSEVPIDDLDGELVDREWEAVLRSDDGASFRAALRRCVDALPERGRLALDLRYRDEAGRADMARALGVSEAGVKQLLRRLRAGLRECIERRLER